MSKMIRLAAVSACVILTMSGMCACSSAAPAATSEPAKAAESAKEAEITPEPEQAATEESIAEDAPESVCTVYLGGAEEATNGMEKVDDTFNDDGSYRYEHVSDDGMLAVCEAGKLLPQNGSSSPEEAAVEMARWILLESETSADETVKLNDEYSANATYPVYIVSFTTGSNEDTWSWKAYTVATDTCGLVYAIGAPADFDEDMLALAEKVFPKLRVIDKDEGLETNDGIYRTDLYDYYGKHIDDVAVDFPSLQYDDSYKTSDEDTTGISEPAEDMEKMSDGLALAGPFFSINKEGKVVGISYGGKTYCVNGISIGTPVSEAIETVKKSGFKFNRVEIAHGTAKYVAIYDNGDTELCIVSDEDGNTQKTEEGDVTGNVDMINIYTK